MTRSVNKRRLENRGVLGVAGTDAKTFLQGLLTNDMDLVTPDQAIYASFLTPQGKFFCDLFVVQGSDQEYLLDIDRTLLPGFLKKLTLYKLKSNVVLKDLSADYSIWALWGDTVCDDFDMPCTLGRAKSYEGGMLYVDPRKTEMGFRAFVPHAAMVDPQVDKNPLEHHPKGDEGVIYSLYAGKESLKSLTQFPNPPAWMMAHLEASEGDFEHLRLTHGIPECGKELIPEKSIPLEVNLDRLNGISFEKGCYLGQELIARTSHRGLVRKRLMPVRIEGAALPPDTDLVVENKKIGTLYSSYQDKGLAMIRLEALETTTTFEIQTQDTTTTIKVMEQD